MIFWCANALIIGALYYAGSDLVRRFKVDPMLAVSVFCALSAITIVAMNWLMP